MHSAVRELVQQPAVDRSEQCLPTVQNTSQLTFTIKKTFPSLLTICTLTSQHHVGDPRHCQAAISAWSPRSKAQAVTQFWGEDGLSRLLCSGALQWQRSEEHTSELQSLMRISYAVFCL